MLWGEESDVRGPERLEKDKSCKIQPSNPVHLFLVLSHFRPEYLSWEKALYTEPVPEC